MRELEEEEVVAQALRARGGAGFASADYSCSVSRSSTADGGQPLCLQDGPWPHGSLHSEAYPEKRKRAGTMNIRRIRQKLHKFEFEQKALSAIVRVLKVVMPGRRGRSVT